jgi:uncharacterized protein
MQQQKSLEGSLMKSRFKAIFLLISLFSLISSTVYSVSIPKRPSAYIMDLAGVINDNVEVNLNGYLRELEEKTTAQMVVLSIDSLEGESLDALSIHIAHDKWKLGHKGKDNGVLLLVAIQERKYRIEVGYGLEGVLPDSLVGSIGRQYIVPSFRKGDYSTGLLTSTLAIISEIASDAGVEITGMPTVRNRTPYRGVKRGKSSLASKIFAIFFFVGLIYMFIRHPRLLLLLVMMSMMGGGRRSGWGGGGGFGGGGFGGGGGGGFGGGGASGGW